MKKKKLKKKKERQKKKKWWWWTSRTSIHGKIVVDALALVRLVGSARWSHGNSEISRSAFLLPSRAIGGLPPSAIPYSVSLTPRFIGVDEMQRSRERERGSRMRRREERNEKPHGKGPWSEEERMRRERLKGRQGERQRRCAQDSFRYDKFARIPFQELSPRLLLMIFQRCILVVAPLSILIVSQIISSLESLITNRSRFLDRSIYEILQQSSFYHL